NPPPRGDDRVCETPFPDALTFPAQMLMQDVDPPLASQPSIDSVREAVPWVHHERTHLIPRRTNHTLGVNDQPAAFGGQNIEVMEVPMHHHGHVILCKEIF